MDTVTFQPLSKPKELADISIRPFRQTELCKIFTKYGSDKGVHGHNYSTLYTALFEKFRSRDSLNIFELGLGTNNLDVPSNMGPGGKPGASLFGWAEYFPRALVCGADIDKRILFQSERIKTFYCDQTNAESVRDLWKQVPLKDISFDIILDDGLHSFAGQYTFLDESLHKLKDDGIFICEDLRDTNITQFTEKFDTLHQKFPKVQFQIVRMPHTYNNTDNNLLVGLPKDPN